VPPPTPTLAPISDPLFRDVSKQSGLIVKDGAPEDDPANQQLVVAEPIE
jgi:hypothetical protein